MVLLCGVLLLASTAPAAQVFWAGYNGNTGNGGLDADVGAGGAAVIGTWGDPTITTGGNGVYGEALDSDWTNDGSVNDGVQYNGGGNVPSSGTIAMWVSTPVMGDGKHAYWAATADWTKGLVFVIHSAYGMLFRQIGGGDIFLPFSLLGETDSLHHIAYSWEAGSLKAYIDGSLAGSFAGGIALPAIDHLVLGAGTPGHSVNQSWTGRVDDARVFDTVLSEAEITDVMNIPEPASMTLLGLASLTLLRRRHRCR
jgi:hypothetical protein